MTEAEWLSADDVSGMIQHLNGARAPERKYRLFALECVRTIRSHLRDKRSLAALEFVEANAEKPLGHRLDKNLRRRCRRVERAAAVVEEAATAVRRTAERDAHCHPDLWNQIVLDASAAAAARFLLVTLPSSAATLCARYAEDVVAAAAHEPYQPGVQSPNSWNAYERQRRLNVAWFLDIFGNPFRPVAFDAAWRTDTAVSLARGMYDSRDFGAMPILADALQDAGCTSDDVLTHCRDAHATHVRGCWVVDLVLGKE